MSKLPLTDYPVIDMDPHFGRVVRYMRPSDYATWAGAAAAGPAVFWGLGECLCVLSCMWMGQGPFECQDDGCICRPEPW